MLRSCVHQSREYGDDCGDTDKVLPNVDAASFLANDVHEGIQRTADKGERVREKCKYAERDESNDDPVDHVL